MYGVQFQPRPDFLPAVSAQPEDPANMKEGTRKAYMTVGTLFFLYIFFYNDSEVPAEGALFTWQYCGSFLSQYIGKPKKLTERGTAGLKIPSMGM